MKSGVKRSLIERTRRCREGKAHSHKKKLGKKGREGKGKEATQCDPYGKRNTTLGQTRQIVAEKLNTSARMFVASGKDTLVWGKRKHTASKRQNWPPRKGCRRWGKKRVGTGKAKTNPPKSRKAASSEQKRAIHAGRGTKSSAHGGVQKRGNGSLKRTGQRWDGGRGGEEGRQEVGLRETKKPEGKAKRKEGKFSSLGACPRGVMYCWGAMGGGLGSRRFVCGGGDMCQVLRQR